MTKLGYLSTDVKVEPLVSRWYAFSMLVPPVSSALFLVRKLLPLLRSYLEDPEAHADALQEPSLAGGPFVDLPVERAGEAQVLLDETLRSAGHLIELERDVQRLAELVTSASGDSLERLYASIPASLQGMTELAYDSFGRANFRFFEPLVYASPLYVDATQELALGRVRGDHRAFTLSTPTFPGPGVTLARTPFANRAVDRLYTSRFEGVNVEQLADDLKIDARDREGFAALFTDTPRLATAPRYDGEGVRVRYFGHACVLLETKHVSILTDPAIGLTYPGMPDDRRFSLQDLPAHIDYVLISHNHQDHLLFEMLLMLRHRIGTLIVPRAAGGSAHDPSLRLVLEQIGFESVRELGDLEALPVPSGTIRGLPFLGEHGDLDIRAKLVWSVELEGRHVVLAADTNNIDPHLYPRVRAHVPAADILFIGMECAGAPFTWGYGPTLMRQPTPAQEQARRLNGSGFESVKALVDCFGAKQVYVYAMGQEPWLSHVMGIHYEPDSPPLVESNRLIAHCRERGLPSERLYISKQVVL